MVADAITPSREELLQAQTGFHDTIPLVSCMATRNPAMFSLQLHVLTNVRSLCVTRTNGLGTPFGLVAAAQLFSWRASPPGFESSVLLLKDTRRGRRSPQPHSPSGRMGFSVVDTVHLVCEFQSWPTAQPRCSPLAYPLARFVSVLLRSHALLAISVCQLHHS